MPDVLDGESMRTTSLLAGIVVAAALVVAKLRERSNQARHAMESEPYPFFIAKYAVFVAIIVGLSWNVDTNFRINLDGRYYGTTNPSVGGTTWTNNNLSVMLGLQIKFGAAAVAPPPPPPVAQAPSNMVFFDWDRSNLSAQALNTIKQAANAFKTKGNARITATGHTDKSGPENYNMALSLRRANAVKDALVRNGVPATAISVVGKGESQPLVPTADGVREPQNRRVEIVIQ